MLTLVEASCHYYYDGYCIPSEFTEGETMEVAISSAIIHMGFSPGLALTEWSRRNIVS